MTKRFDEEVRVERDTGMPSAFEWRGTRYEVADVIGRWRIEGRWWADGRDREYWRVEDALRRLYTEPETFGICHSCKKEIPFERLDALPHARYCLDCKLREEEEAAA